MFDKFGGQGAAYDDAVYFFGNDFADAGSDFCSVFKEKLQFKFCSVSVMTFKINSFSSLSIISTILIVHIFFSCIFGR